MIDLVTDPTSISLVNTSFRANRPTAAVYHGSGAFVNVTDSNNVSNFKSRRATGFSNLEEETARIVKKIPFLLEDSIRSNGGKYEKALELWGEYVVVEGNLVTGKNPTSARAVGQAILKALE
ncbi:hypothetical protein FRB96_006468 [Tulasnella sp. 330]|nr:hypothetical protein FRB96_006468 [Tulasnella sp. 330]KAG8879126.1 hypothetical protein FRB97_001951 [Tulasnella sp. 331]KAG8888029.1 hypothetical protein FRB98_008563 [Tulasnella sp. 332]